MSTQNWIIGIGAATLAALLGIWYSLTHIGDFLVTTFPASLLEQVGNALTTVGNAALGAFVMVILVALIIVAIVLIIREKVIHTY